MNPWLDDVVPDWRLTDPSEPSEVERAYLLNDIGPLFYVFNTIAPDICAKAIDDIPIEA